MGKYLIRLSTKAKKDLQKIKKSGRLSELKKIEKLFLEISENPRIGTGQVEQLKYINGEVWSRRLNKKDRFVYEIFEDEILVIVISILGHYDF